VDLRVDRIEVDRIDHIEVVVDKGQRRGWHRSQAVRIGVAVRNLAVEHIDLVDHIEEFDRILVVVGHILLVVVDHIPLVVVGHTRQLVGRIEDFDRIHLGRWGSRCLVVRVVEEDNHLGHLDRLGYRSMSLQTFLFVRLSDYLELMRSGRRGRWVAGCLYIDDLS